MTADASRAVTLQVGVLQEGRGKDAGRAGDTGLGPEHGRSSAA